ACELGVQAEHHNVVRVPGERAFEQRLGLGRRPELNPQMPELELELQLFRSREVPLQASFEQIGQLARGARLSVEARECREGAIVGRRESEATLPALGRLGGVTGALPRQARRTPQVRRVRGYVGCLGDALERLRSCDWLVVVQEVIGEELRQEVERAQL